MKVHLKSFMVELLVSMVLGQFPFVEAWVNGSSYWYTIETRVRIDLDEDPVFFDLLIIKDEAPLRSPSELVTLLPDEYRTGPFAEALNGYRDADGFVSFRLYHEDYVSIYQITNDTYEYLYSTDLPVRMKFVYIFEDGRIFFTPELTQRQNTAFITYGLRTLGIQESTNLMPEPEVFVPEPPVDAFFRQYREASTPMFVLIVVANLLIFLLILGYRKPKSFVIVGFIRWFVLTLGTILILLETWIPSVPFALLFWIFYVGWMFLESFFLPRWLGERTMERTMVYSWTCNVILMLLLVFHHFMR
jgi:hypothetical protein